MLSAVRMLGLFPYGAASIFWWSSIFRTFFRSSLRDILYSQVKFYSFEEQLSYLPWDLSVKMLSNNGSSIAVVV